MPTSFPEGLGQVVYEYDYFCLAEGTPILVKDSNDKIYLKQIESFEKGDRILSINQNTQQQEWKGAILTKREAPKRILYIQAGTSFCVTEKHKMLLPGFQEIPAGALNEGDHLLAIDYLNLPETRKFIDLVKESNLPLSEKVYIDEEYIGHIRNRGRITPKKCIEGLIPRKQELDYNFGLFIGLYLAEGSRSPRTSLSFALHQEESEISDFLSKFSIERLNINAKVTVLPEYTRRVVYLHRKIFTDIFTTLFPGNCYSKKLPYWVFDAPKDFKLGILHGWLFGDGTFQKSAVIGKTVSLMLARGLHDLALSLGIHSSISVSNKVNILTFYGKDNLDRLFSLQTFWKHSHNLRCYIESVTTYSKEYIEQQFRIHYSPGMSKEDFLAHCDFGESPIFRIWGSWNSLLQEMGFSGYAKRCHGLSKNELLAIGSKWLLSRNNKFSVTDWDHDISVPSSGEIYKYFSSVEDFLIAIKNLVPAIEDNTKQEENNKSTCLSHKEIRKIKSLQYDSLWVYDLTVKDNHNFLIGGILTHNCGSQVQVFFEEILVDDIVRIAWGVQQNRQPIYGYASQYFNAVADGVIIGGGSFWVAYKEAGYIPIILERIASRRFAMDDFYSSPAMSPSDGRTVDTSLGESAATFGGRDSTHGRIHRMNIERIMQLEESGVSEEEIAQIMQQYAVNISALNDREFENMSEQFEDASWYGGNSPQSGRGEAMSGNYSRHSNHNTGENPDFYLGLRRADQYPPFDIIVTFGDINTSAANHTLQRLTDCIITNTQFGPIDITGEPIYVQFDFLARNMM